MIDWDISYDIRNNFLEQYLENFYHNIFSIPIELIDIILSYVHSTGFKVIYNPQYLCCVKNCYENKFNGLLCMNHLNLYKCCIFGCSNKNLSSNFGETFDPSCNYFICPLHRCKNMTTVYCPIRKKTKYLYICRNAMYKYNLCKFHYNFARGYSSNNE